MQELTDEQKIVAAKESLDLFFKSLGPDDIYKKILLQVLFEELNNPEIYKNNKLFVDIEL